jgi:hypothetical protein
MKKIIKTINKYGYYFILMFILGHIGLTIGLLIMCLILVDKSNLIFHIDFRIIIIIALLPDIIDKIIGHGILQTSLNNGRLFSHTLAFLFIFIIIYYLIFREKWWIFSFPIMTHQVFDFMWSEPETWYWPYYGWSFDVLDKDVWDYWWQELTSDPVIFTTEIFGVIVIIAFILYLKLFRKENLIQFFKTGKVPKQINEN